MKTLLISTMILLMAAAGHAAVIGTYVEAEPTNTARALPPSWYTTADSSYDSLWQIDQGATSTHPSYEVWNEHDAVVAYQALEPDTPMISTTIDGLTPGSSYDIRLVFGSHTALNHSILGGLASDSLAVYDLTNSDVAEAGTFFYEEGYMDLRQVLLGTATADAQGAITAYVKGNESGNSLGRAIYDGLTYAAPGTTGAGLIGSYVEAEPENTVNVEPVPEPPDWYTTADDAGDSLWEIDQGATSTHPSYEVWNEHDGVVAYQAIEPNAPMLVTTIDGLTPGSSYDIRLAFGSHTALNHSILGGLASDSLTVYDLNNSAVAEAGTFEYEEGYMDLRQALLGTAVADAQGEIKAYIMGNESGNGDGRAIYDGVSYIEAGAGSIPGDTDYDGDVDADDASTLASNWLSTAAGWSMGDFNGDNKVDDIDATLLATNWTASSTGSASVPEPNTAVLLVLGILMIAARRKNTAIEGA